MKSNSGGKAVRYNKWGYIFLIPFIVVFVIFQLFRKLHVWSDTGWTEICWIR